MALKPRELAKLIDHTMLKATANVEDIKKTCEEALKYKFAAVCVNPIFVPMCVKLLRNSSVKVVAAISYPLGASTTEAKAFETRQMVREGAQEIDVVVNMSALKSRAYDLVRDDIKGVVVATRSTPLGSGAMVKAVLEIGALSKDQLLRACTLALEGGAEFIKTSTDFYAPRPLKLEQISLIRKAVGREIGIAATGQIETFEQAVEFLDAGANRISTSFGVVMVRGKETPVAVE